MTDFITRIVTPGAAPFSDVEMQTAAKVVILLKNQLESARQKDGGIFGREWRDISRTAVNRAQESHALAENRYAAMMLHNRLCAIEQWQREEGR